MADNFANGVLVGLIIGGVVGAILGWFLTFYQRWVRERDAARKPQLVVHPTAKTPTQVIEAAARAQAKIWLVRFIIFVVLPFILIEGFMPTVADLINGMIVDVWHMLFG